MAGTTTALQTKQLQTDAILKKYVTLSAQNDTTLAACTTVSCVDEKCRTAGVAEAVRDNVSELSGGKALGSVPNREVLWFVKLEDGTTIHMRSESASKVSRWTVDVVGNDDVLSVARTNKRKVEVKFK